MRKILIKLLFRLLEVDIQTPFTLSDKSKLRKELAKLYNSGIFISWLISKEVYIYKLLRVGVSEEEYKILRGRLLELESIRNEVNRSHEAEQKIDNAITLSRAKSKEK